MVILAWGCSGDKEDGFDRKTAYGNSWNEITEKYHVTDTVGLEIYDIKATSEGQSVLLGLKDGKLWVALHDDTGGALRYEYTTEENYELNRTIHLGYNEYAHVNAGNLSIGDIMLNEYGVVFDIPVEGDVKYLMMDICFISENGMRLQTNIEAAFTFPWYDGGIWAFYDPTYNSFVRFDNYSYFFDRHGELLFKKEIRVFSEIKDFFIPISTNECIGFISLGYNGYWLSISKDIHTLSRLNMKDGAVIWEVRPLENMEGDFIVESSSITSVNKESVTCSSNIVYKNGDTRSVNFTVDIETGAVVMED